MSRPARGKCPETRGILSTYVGARPFQGKLVGAGKDGRSVTRYARWLFGISAVTNLAVSGALLLFGAFVARRLALDPIVGTNVVLFNFAGMLIGLFGYAYVRVAVDPGHFRPLIHVTAIGKLLAFASAALPWLTGIISSRLPLVLSADVIFAILFFDYLRRTKPSPARP
jgi:hypothetical protein